MDPFGNALKQLAQQAKPESKKRKPEAAALPDEGPPAKKTAPAIDLTDDGEPSLLPAHPVIGRKPGLTLSPSRIQEAEGFFRSLRAQCRTRSAILTILASSTPESLHLASLTLRTKIPVIIEDHIANLVAVPGVGDPSVLLGWIMYYEASHHTMPSDLPAATPAYGAAAARMLVDLTQDEQGGRERGVSAFQLFQDTKWAADVSLLLVNAPYASSDRLLSGLQTYFPASWFSAPSPERQVRNYENMIRIMQIVSHIHAFNIISPDEADLAAFLISLPFGYNELVGRLSANLA